MHRVVMLALDGVIPFELGIPPRIFGGAKDSEGEPLYEVITCTVDGGPVRTDADFSISVEHGAEVLSTADTVVIPATHALGAISADGRLPEPLSRGDRLHPARAPAWCRSAPPPTCSRRPDCSTAARRPRTGAAPSTSRSCSPRSRSTPTCCSSTTATCSPGRGRRRGRPLPAHHPPRPRQRGGQPRWPGGASSRPGATAARPSTSSAPSRRGPRRPPPRPEPGRWGSCDGRPLAELAAHARMSRPHLHPALPRGDGHVSPGAVAHPAARASWPGGCWRPRTCRWTASPLQAGFGTAASLRQHLQAAIGVSPMAYRRTFRPLELSLRQEVGA